MAERPDGGWRERGRAELRHRLTMPAAVRGRGPRLIRLLAIGSLAASAAGELTGRRGLAAGSRLPVMLCLAGEAALGTHDDASVPTPLLTGLAFAAVGDTVMASRDSRTCTLAGIGLFSGTHASYLYGYLRRGGWQVIRARPAVLAGAVAVHLAMVGMLWPRLEEPLRWPVSGYGALLFAAGAAAWLREPLCGLGAGLFAVSDLMIALRLTGRTFRGQQLLIYLSYLAGQYLISRHAAVAMAGPA